MPIITNAPGKNGHAAAAVSATSSTPRAKARDPSGGSRKKARQGDLVSKTKTKPTKKTDLKELAMALAKDPNLMDRIAGANETLGLVGERSNGQLMYVCYTSRKLERPLAGIVRGKSSSGKNQVQDIPARLMPTGAVIGRTEVSPKALSYSKEDFRHKILKLGERRHRQDDDQADATALIRQLVSEGRIDRDVVINGKVKRLQVEGPVAFTENTTSESIFAEDLNRCLQVFTDESQKQTEAILAAQADRYLQNSEHEAARQQAIKMHRKFQSLLKKHSVYIPYARDIKIPPTKLEARRVFQQVLSTIEAVTLLHQFQRETNEHGQLIATRQDYEIAHRLLKNPLEASLGGDLYKHYRELRDRCPDKFSAADAVEQKCFGTKVTCISWLKKLQNEGVLKCVVKAKGNRPAKWKWTNKTLEQMLPDVAEVFA